MASQHDLAPRLAHLKELGLTVEIDDNPVRWLPLKDTTVRIIVGEGTSADDTAVMITLPFFENLLMTVEELSGASEKR